MTNDIGPRPPTLARWMVRLIAGRTRRDDVEADLGELFAARAAIDRRRARRRYWRDVASLTVPRRRAGTPRGQGPRSESPIAGGLAKDAAYALRTLLRARGFATTAILTLALGIGANVGVFSVVDAILLRPLPYPQPEELVLIDGAPFSMGRGPMSVARAVEESDALAGVGLFMPGGLNLGVEPQALRIPAASVSAGFFQAFAMPFALGRPFTRDEEVDGANQVVVLAHRLWTERFGSDRGVLGRSLRLNDRPYLIVGVAPAGFDFPQRSSVWIPPFADKQIAGQAFAPDVIGRLAPGVSPAHLRHAIEEIDAKRRPAGADAEAVTITRLHEELTGGVRPVLLILVAGVTVVLLIACTNAANLLLARVAAREREIQIRRALGATRWRLARQLLTESLVLSLIAGMASLVVAWWTLHAARLVVPATLPGADSLSLDGRAVAVAALLSLLTALLFGLGPSLSGWSRDEGDPLRSRRAIGATRTWRFVRGALVAAEVAMAVALLGGASVLVRTIDKLLATDMGFLSARVLTLQVTLPSSNYRAAEIRQFAHEALQRLHTVPGVVSAGATNMVPGSTEVGIAFGLKPLEGPVANVPSRGIRWMSASPALFSALGIRVVRGRAFADTDTATAPKVVVLSESAARRLWPDGRDPIGQQVSLNLEPPNDAPRQVVGVVGDVRPRGPDSGLSSQAYAPVDQNPPYGNMQFAIRTTGDPAAVAGDIRALLAREYPTLPSYNVRTMDDTLAAFLAERRFGMMAMSVFAGLALMLAGVGLFGLLAHLVEQRRGEIGIRMALGADAGRVRRDVVLSGVRHAVAGVPLGLLGAWWLARTIGGLVTGAEPVSALSLVAVTLTMLVIAAAAAFVPALRATRVDPLTALRAE